SLSFLAVENRKHQPADGNLCGVVGVTPCGSDVLDRQHSRTGAGSRWARSLRPLAALPYRTGFVEPSREPISEGYGAVISASGTEKKVSEERLPSGRRNGLTEGSEPAGKEPISSPSRLVVAAVRAAAALRGRAASGH